MPYPYVKLTENRSVEWAEKYFEANIADAKHIHELYIDDMSYRNCPICDSNCPEKFESYHDSFKVNKCLKCCTPYVNPVPSHKALKYYYNHGFAQKLLNELYAKRAKQTNPFFLDERIKCLIELVDKFKTDKLFNILEVGCHNGSFLSKVKQAFAENVLDKEVYYYGIDIDQNALAMNRDKDLNLINGWAEDLCKQPEMKGKFDIVCHFELLEHLADPISFMKSVRELMKPGAYMLLTTPNYLGLEITAMHYNDYRLMAHSIMPPNHLNAFSTHNFTHFAINTGYNIVDIATPGKLDVDCLSIYSQKNENLDPLFKVVEQLDEDTRGWLQALIAYLGASSTMRIVLQKPG